MSGARRASALSLGEALDRLRAPDVSERYSPLTGEPWLLVELRPGDRDVAPDEAASLREALRSIPVPSLALADAEPGGAGALLDGFDLVLAPDELAPVLARIHANPLAAMGLVQLLRHGEGRDTETGLVLESLVYATLQAGPEFAAWLATHERKDPPPPAEPPVLVRRELDRLHLRLNRPERRNAFSAEMRDALCEGLALALCDDSIAEVVLTGAGPAFSGGGDLDEFGTLPDPTTAHAIRSTRNAARLLDRCRARVRAELQGACVGAGVELPAYASRVVARPDAFFQLPELAMGLVPGAGGTVSLPRRIGRQRTAWLALSGARLDAETALAWGLVDEIGDVARDD